MTGYAWRPGRVDTGVVLASGTWSRTEAERRCTALAACNGFFFPWAASNHVPPAPSAAVPVSLTNGTFGQSGTWRNPAFQTYIKQRVPDPLCPALHPIHSPGIFDPSGGLQTADGQWHTFEDSGGWFHYVSPDLIDWRPAPQISTGFHIHGGMTGAVSRLKGGGFAAFLPNTNQTGMWRSFSHDLNSWQWPPTTPIKVPPHALPHNFRDPGTAMTVKGRHFIPVGCGSPAGGEISWQQASDDTLTSFELAGRAPGTAGCGGGKAMTLCRFLCVHACANPKAFI